MPVCQFLPAGCLPVLWFNPFTFLSRLRMCLGNLFAPVNNKTVQSVHNNSGQPNSFIFLISLYYKDAAERHQAPKCVGKRVDCVDEELKVFSPGANGIGITFAYRQLVICQL